MAIPVASLGESLVAEGARKGAHSFVRAHVVHHVAQLGELLGALKALQHLVLPPSLLIQTLNFSESFSFPNRSHVALFTDFLFMTIALSSFWLRWLIFEFWSKIDTLFRQCRLESIGILRGLLFDVVVFGRGVLLSGERAGCDGGRVGLIADNFLQFYLVWHGYVVSNRTGAGSHYLLILLRHHLLLNLRSCIECHSAADRLSQLRHQSLQLVFRGHVIVILWPVVLRCAFRGWELLRIYYRWRVQILVFRYGIYEIRNWQVLTWLSVFLIAIETCKSGCWFKNLLSLRLKPIFERLTSLRARWDWWSS